MQAGLDKTLMSIQGIVSLINYTSNLITAFLWVHLTLFKYESMRKYAVKLKVIFDGKYSELISVGSFSNSSDHSPNNINNTVTKYFTAKYPQSKISTVISGVKELKNETE